MSWRWTQEAHVCAECMDHVSVKHEETMADETVKNVKVDWFLWTTSTKRVEAYNAVSHTNDSWARHTA